MKIKEKKGLVDFLFPGVSGVTLAPFGIYLSKRSLKNAKTIRHEKIHWKQQMEMMILPFYAWYLAEWLIRLLTDKGNAYKSISFEKELIRMKGYQISENQKIIFLVEVYFLNKSVSFGHS